MAEVPATQEAMEALDTARFVGDTKRIAAAKLALVQAIAATHKPTETHPNTEPIPLGDIRRMAQRVPDSQLKLEFVGWLEDVFPI
jgi:hypothetical protein